MEMHCPLSSAQHKSQVAFLYKTLSNSENPFFQSRLITFVESAILSWGTWDLSQYPLFCAFTFIHCFEYRARRSILSRNWIPPEEFNISILSLQTIKLLPSVQIVRIRERGNVQGDSCELRDTFWVDIQHMATNDQNCFHHRCYLSLSRATDTEKNGKET